MARMCLAARVYWGAICLLGLACAALSRVLPFPQRPSSVYELIIFWVLGLLFGGYKISLNRLRHDEETMSMSMGFAITFASLLSLGPAGAMPVAILTSFSSCMYPKRMRVHIMAFNVCLSAIEVLVGSYAFVGINGWTLGLDPFRTFGAVAGSSLCFYLVNTYGVATMMGLYTHQRVFRVWKENFSWTAPSYFASACVGALAMQMFRGNSLAVVLFILPVAILVYHMFRTYIGRIEDGQRHIEELQTKQSELAELYIATIKSLALAIEAKDVYTHQHILRVQRYAVAIAGELGLEGVEMEGVRTGALLHDIGKLGVPEHVLLKPGPLTVEEYEKIKEHPKIGAAILGPVEFPWPVTPSVRHHHERWDGKGYPDGLKGDEIPRTARIMSVADVFDAVTSSRSYRDAVSHQEAVRIVREASGSQFDPTVVEAFLKVIDGVVKEMALEGLGPLAPMPEEPRLEFSA